MSRFDHNRNWMLPLSSQSSTLSRQLPQPDSAKRFLKRAKPTCGPVSFPDYSCEGPTTSLAILNRFEGPKTSKPQEIIFGQLPPQIPRSSYELERTPWKHKVGLDIIRTFKKDVTTWKSMLLPRSNYGKFVGTLFDSISDKNDYTIYEETRSSQPSKKQIGHSPPQSPHFRSHLLNKENMPAYPPVLQNIPINSNIMFQNNNVMVTGRPKNRYTIKGPFQYALSEGMTSRYIKPQLDLKFRVSAQYNPYRNLLIPTLRDIKYKYNLATFSQPPVLNEKNRYQGLRNTKTVTSKPFTIQNIGTEVLSTQRYLPSRVNFVTIATVASQDDSNNQMTTSVVKQFKTANTKNNSARAWPKYKIPSKTSGNLSSRDPIFDGMKFQHTSTKASSRSNLEENTRDYIINFPYTSPKLETDDFSRGETTVSFLKQENLLRLGNFNNIKQKPVVTTSQDEVVANSSLNKLLSDESQTRSNTVNSVLNTGTTINIKHDISMDSPATDSDNIAVLRDAPGSTSAPPTFYREFGSNTTQIWNVINQSMSSQETTYSYNSSTTMKTTDNYTVPDMSKNLSLSVPVQTNTSQRTMWANNTMEQWGLNKSDSNVVTTPVDKLLQSMMLGLAAGQSSETKSKDGPQRDIFPLDLMQYGVTSDDMVLP
ncbi:unnamed protein product [Spodoptera exigua]|nr:unnamed protein product [Spodoptera exigua]